MFNIIRRKWKTWDLKEDGNILNDFKNRGVDKPGVLPNYHYRDDAKLLWEAIEKYVTDVVDKVYGELNAFIIKKGVINIHITHTHAYLLMLVKCNYNFMHGL